MLTDCELRGMLSGEASVWRESNAMSEGESMSDYEQIREWIDAVFRLAGLDVVVNGGCCAHQHDNILVNVEVCERTRRKGSPKVVLHWDSGGYVAITSPKLFADPEIFEEFVRRVRKLPPIIQKVTDYLRDHDGYGTSE